MLQNHSHVKMVQIKPAVLEYIMNGPVASESVATVCDPCDTCDGQSDTHNKNLQKNNEKIIKRKMFGVSIGGSYTSHSKLLRCYYCEKAGTQFETDDVAEYEKHGDLKHRNKSLYPNKATIKKHKLKAQDKEWEI